MSNYKTHDLIEQVKYGQGAPTYAGDLQADLLDALEDITRLQDLIGILVEAFPKAGDFDTITVPLMTNPTACTEFGKLVAQWQATLDGLKSEAEALGVEV